MRTSRRSAASRPAASSPTTTRTRGTVVTRTSCTARVPAIAASVRGRGADAPGRRSATRRRTSRSRPAAADVFTCRRRAHSTPASSRPWQGRGRTRRRVGRGYGRDGLEQPPNVDRAGRDPRRRADRARSELRSCARAAACTRSSSSRPSASRRATYGCAQEQPCRTPMPDSALSRAATRAWGTPLMTNVAAGSVSTSSPGPSRRTPGIAARPARSCAASAATSAAIRGDPRRADVRQLTDRRRERDGAEDIG